jgi:hypothetical protein
MKKSQFEMLLYNVREDLDILPGIIPIADNAKIESVIQEKKLLVEFDAGTHGNQKLYEHFLEHRDLKWIWCNAGDRYGVDPAELYQICPDRCPVFGTLLDYGLGKNISTNHPAYRPSMDHLNQQSRGGTKRGDISNFEVMSVQANMFRNNSTPMQQLYLLRYELKKLDKKTF